MTARAIEVLGEVDLVAAEDTRHSAVLFRHFGIETPLLAYHEHSHERAVTKVAKILNEGGAVALISDAGTPLISDPGYRLVQFAHEQGYTIVPIPGPCAAIAALSASGLATDRFLFEGFLPAKEAARAERLNAMVDQRATMIFYEAPHRIEATLAAMCKVFGMDREVLLARELTKTFETLLRGSLGSVLQQVSADSNQRRGEMVLIVQGCAKRLAVIDSSTAQLLQAMAQEMPARKAAELVARFSGLRKNQLYQYLLDNK